MPKFRKKPVVIEAIQWNGNNFDEIMNFMQKDYGTKLNYENAEGVAIKSGQLTIETSEGFITASTNDWVIKGVKGEFYPCKSDIFESTYDLADKKKLYYRLSDGMDFQNVTMQLSGVCSWIEGDAGNYEEGDELPQYIIDPVWMTEGEFDALPEGDL